ncbi:hypothetical protein ACFSJ3_00280 [Corallincola platygyrae]|uniref:Uncharacterized protein n=1 Tax=Corallincola platygyrae TaxID=1193278 RepID=A0ABW4XHA1_9GAMM
MSVFGSRNYKLEDAAQEPVIYLSKLMKLDQHYPFIRSNKDKVLPVLTGVLLYRQLSRFEQNKVLPLAKSLGNEKFLGAIQVLLAQNVANPNWNKWCLSDKELREFFDSNKTVSDLINSWFFTIDPKLEASWIAALIFGVSTTGLKGWIADVSGAGMVKQTAPQVAKQTGLKITKSGVNTAARYFIVVTILASVMKGMSDADMKQARAELLRRGLLTVKDLE